jgi:hypothetical protein
MSALSKAVTCRRSPQRSRSSACHLIRVNSHNSCQKAFAFLAWFPPSSAFGATSAVRLIRSVVGQGVTFFDNCPVSMSIQELNLSIIDNRKIFFQTKKPK